MIDYLLGFLARFFVGIFKDWRRDEELKDKGRNEQAAKEEAELSRTVAVTEEEDDKASTDADAALDDELKRPL